jgi:putative PIN family toxin of toxin-antitoxin system
MSDLKFVIDTNVLISAALFSQSKPRLALDKVQEEGVLLLSGAVFAELESVLYRTKFDRYISLSKRSEFLEDLLKSSQFIEPNQSITICRDEKDNKYLELAVSGKATAIITGDEDLLVLNPFQSVQISTVQEFLENEVGLN